MATAVEEKPKTTELLAIDTNTMADDSARLTPESLGSPPFITVRSAITSDKSRQRELNAMFDKWLMGHGNNLYPSREEKETLARNMNLTYIQVNRWFANRRRKQTKRKAVAGATSPVLNKENLNNIGLSNTPEMVAHAGHGHEAGVVEDMGQPDSPQSPSGAFGFPSMTSPLNEVAMKQLLAANPLYHPLLVALATHGAGALHNLQNPLALAQILQAQAAALQHTIINQQLAHVVQQVQQGASVMPPAATWMSPPISASPQESLSDPTESPRPTANSPAFKDPHGIADPDHARLLEYDLSEKESIAISVLMSMTDR